MTPMADGGSPPVQSLSRRLSREDVTMDLTMCGLLPERAEQLVRLYEEYGTWSGVEDVWYDEKLSNRSTRGSSQKIYRVLTSRFKNAPASLPSPNELTAVLDRCRTARDRAQVLYLYLVADDPLVRYAVHEYARRIASGTDAPLSVSNDTLTRILSELEYSNGGSFDYAPSTVERWCVGFRSVLRAIGVLDGRQSVSGEPPTIGDVPLLVAVDYSYAAGDEDWLTAPRGLCQLFQPEDRWEELFDRAAGTAAWEYVELHGELDLRPTGEPYAWTQEDGL